LSLPVSFPDQNFVCISHLSDACFLLCSSHPPWFDRCNNIRFNTISEVLEMHKWCLRYVNCFSSNLWIVKLYKRGNAL
jgi:hypothetical protein